MQHLVVYSRRGCHLCEDQIAELELLCRRQAMSFEVVDVDSDPELAARFGTRVPVLLHDGEELCAGRWPVAQLGRLIAR